MTILIADDEAIIRSSITDLLRPFAPHFTRLITAEDGLEAVEKVKACSPQLIIFDINMPFLNGLEAIGQIRAFNPNMIIIIISGYNKFEYAQQAIESHVFAYLLKPINQEEFTKTLTKAIKAAKEQGSSLSQGPTPPGEQALGKNILAYIHQHLGDSSLTVNKVCNDFHISPSSLSRIIKKEKDSTFSSYLTKIRITQAIALLTRQEDLTIKEISAQTGYKNQHYFSRAFKNYTGLAPKQYMQSIQK